MWDGNGEKMAAAVVQMSCLYRGMLAVRATGIRTLIPGLVPTQYRAFCVWKEPHMDLNPFFGKYQDKIEKLRSTKPQEYKVRLTNRHENKEIIENAKHAEFIRLMDEEFDKRDKMAAEGRASGGFTKNKTLNSILNVELIRDKSSEDISEMWLTYFSTEDTVSAVIPAQIFDLIINRSQSCPMFLYALPQKDGYEFFVGQWSGNELHFTALSNIQTLGENAPSQLIFYHYPELKEEKGIVLMMAEIDPQFITVHQAQCLANQVQLFYGSQRLETYRLVETFNHHPDEFKHMAVIAELEQSGLGVATDGP